MPEILIRSFVRVQDVFVPMDSGVLKAVGSGDEDGQAGVGGIHQLPAHLGDGVIKNAAGVVGSFANQFHLKKKI